MLPEEEYHFIFIDVVYRFSKQLDLITIFQSLGSVINRMALSLHLEQHPLFTGIHCSKLCVVDQKFINLLV